MIGLLGLLGEEWQEAYKTALSVLLKVCKHSGVNTWKHYEASQTVHQYEQDGIDYPLAQLLNLEDVLDCLN